ncbi:methionyl-tRNA synthetase [Lithohypha guttulata]|uniref:Probable methionine--tRNA ligase, mitochondrial n=1 Tax=Lithohypha guttulata TaxID=1690604 RepID=A0AAN7Y501_9EURO|nr:methionyl-tRNA synthetase [Lithohypha guttulata]
MNASQLRARALLIDGRFSRLLSSSHVRKCTFQARRALHNVPHLQQAQSDRFRPYYVTSPIFYVNAEPHAGHLYTLLLTDVLKRWEVLKGDNQASLLTGTDEHGMKVQKAAESAATATKQFCDKHATQFLDLARAANISFDRFIRTTDPDHKVAVEHFWKQLKERGYIYQSTHEGWYSVSDETFYPESQVHLVLEPSTGRKIYASKETGKEVEWTSETNYHFRLSAFRDRLLEHYDQHPQFIVPSMRMNFIKKEVEAGLSDLSVSRPSSRLQWGIRVPDDDTQTIYVWLDALINYLTATGYPYGEGGNHKLWPPNVQVIGKDIVRFHCIYWPAFLMALDIPLPRAFLTHAHWTMGKAKMSKSLGNGVNPFLAIERFGLDAIRYFMIHDGGIVDDADYDNMFIVEKYKKGLQDGLGNLLTRILRGRKWSIRTSLEQVMNNGSLKKPDSARIQDMIEMINSTARSADEAMQSVNPRSALHNIMKLVYETNKFFQEMAPWNLVKDDHPDSRESLHMTIYTSAEAARVACILLQPFMPNKMQQALDHLHVLPDKRSFQMAEVGCDETYGSGASEAAHEKIPENMKKRIRYAHDGVLFPPLLTEV